VEFADQVKVLRYPPLAIVGGGPGLPSQLDYFKDVEGEVGA